MILDEKQIKKIKIKLALEKKGKSKLAEKLGCACSQISLMLNTGYIPDKYINKLNDYL